jgi:hypothetical protein
MKYEQEVLEWMGRVRSSGQGEFAVVVYQPHRRSQERPRGHK